MVLHAKAHGWSGPPFDPTILAGLHGVKVEATDEDFGSEGRIFPRRGRVVIQYRTGRMIERQRFTICHELAHTCFPDAFEFVRHHESIVSDDEACRRFENLCDTGAAELLIPYDDFSADLRGTCPCLARAIGLGARYVASIDATIKRLLDLTSHSCAAAFLTDESFREFTAVPGRLRVRYFWKSASFKGFLPPGTLLPKDSCAYSASAGARTAFPESRETWWIKGRPRSWFVEPHRLPVIPQNREYPKIVALLHSHHPLNSGLRDGS